jgi:hypothetical protein
VTNAAIGRSDTRKTIATRVTPATATAGHDKCVIYGRNAKGVSNYEGSTATAGSELVTTTNLPDQNFYFLAAAQEEVSLHDGSCSASRSRTSNTLTAASAGDFETINTVVWHGPNLDTALDGEV